MMLIVTTKRDNLDPSKPPLIYNHAHNILRLPDGLASFPFTISERSVINNSKL